MTQKPIVHRATFVGSNSWQHLTNSRQGKIPELTAEKSHFSKSCETKQKKSTEKTNRKETHDEYESVHLMKPIPPLQKKLTSEN